MQRLQHLDELVAEPVLERDAPAVDPARDEHDLLVLDVHALDRADALGEVEHLGLGERRRRVPAALLLPDHGRVQALLDRRPDREGGCEVVALDDEVRAVADRRPRRSRRRARRPRSARRRPTAPGSIPMPTSASRPALLPGARALELVVAELDPDLLVRALGMRLGERHRHVEVGHPRLEARVEDRHVEDGVDRVQHGVGVRLADERVRRRPCSTRRSDAR